MTEKLTRAQHIEALAPTVGVSRFFAAMVVDHFIEGGHLDVAPDPLPEPPETNRVVVCLIGQCWWAPSAPRMDDGRRIWYPYPVGSARGTTTWDDLLAADRGRGKLTVNAEPAYWRDHLDYARIYEAWKEALKA